MSEVVKQARRKQDKTLPEKKQIGFTFALSKLKSQHDSMDWKYTSSMLDLQLTNVISRSTRIERDIQHLIRRKTIDHLGIVDTKNKKARIEVAVAQVLLTGFDERDNKVATAFIEEFKDGIYSTNAEYDEDDNVTYKKGVYYDTYDKAWTSPSTFDEIVNREGYDINLDTCQFSIDGGRGSYSRFSASEWQHLSFEELEIRGQTGFTNQPIDYLISKLPTQDRLKMFNDAKRGKQ